MPADDLGLKNSNNHGQCPHLGGFQARIGRTSQVLPWLVEGWLRLSNRKLNRHKPKLGQKFQVLPHSFVLLEDSKLDEQVKSSLVLLLRFASKVFRV